MESQLPLETIDIIAKVMPLDEVRLRCAKILGQAYEIPGGNFQLFSAGKESINMLVTLGNEKFVLKMNPSETFQVSIEREKWLQDKKNGLVPQIQASGEVIGLGGRKYYYIVQEYIPGEILDSPTLETNPEQLKSLAGELAQLHSVKRGEQQGFGRLNVDKNGRNVSFSEFIDIFKHRMEQSEYFTDEEKERFKKVFEYKKKICGQNLPEPCLVHADFHPGNIIVNTSKTSRIIDFGDMEWGFPERDFATLRTHVWSRENPEKFKIIQDEYESINNKLDSDMFDLMCLCVGTHKFHKRSERAKGKSQDGKNPLYNDLLDPLLIKIETEMKV